MIAITVEREILILILGWMLSHLVLWGFVWERYRSSAVLIATILLVAVYALKPAVGDLWSYGFFFDTGFQQIKYDSEVPARTEPILEGYSINEVAPQFRTGTPYFVRHVI